MRTSVSGLDISAAPSFECLEQRFGVFGVGQALPATRGAFEFFASLGLAALLRQHRAEKVAGIQVGRVAQAGIPQKLHGPVGLVGVEGRPPHRTNDVRGLGFDRQGAFGHLQRRRGHAG